MGKKGETGLKTIITEKYKLMKLGENYDKYMVVQDYDNHFLMTHSGVKAGY